MYSSRPAQSKRLISDLAKGDGLGAGPLCGLERQEGGMGPIPQGRQWGPTGFHLYMSHDTPMDAESLAEVGGLLGSHQTSSSRVSCRFCVQSACSLPPHVTAQVPTNQGTAVGALSQRVSLSFAVGTEGTSWSDGSHRETRPCGKSLANLRAGCGVGIGPLPVSLADSGRWPWSPVDTGQPSVQCLFPGGWPGRPGASLGAAPAPSLVGGGDG